MILVQNNCVIYNKYELLFTEKKKKKTLRVEIFYRKKKEATKFFDHFLYFS